MVAAKVELTHQRLMTLENRTSMMVKAIMPAIDNLKSRITNTNQKLTLQYRMIQMAHHRYNLLFRWTHKMLMIHHFALLLFKNYLTIQVGTLQRIHLQYNRYESALDDTLISIERLYLGTWKPLQMIWKTWQQTTHQSSLMFTSIMVIC